MPKGGTSYQEGKARVEGWTNRNGQIALEFCRCSAWDERRTRVGRSSVAGVWSQSAAGRFDTSSLLVALYAC